MDSNNYLVSIIMNCHNGEEYLSVSIESVLKQTYQNWELIFWDNLSTDKSALIFNQYKDKRLKYFYSNKFESLPIARNRAINKASSNYIAILDTDDEWYKYKLEMQMNAFTNTDIALIYSNCYLLKINKFFSKKIYSKNILPSGNINNHIIKNYRIPNSTILFDLNKINKNKVYNEKYNIINDFILCEELSRKNKFYAVQEPLAIVKIHKKNLSKLNPSLEIKELEDYYLHLKDNFIMTNSNLEFLKDKIIFLKITRNLYSKNILLNILNSLKLKSYKYKIKALLFTLMPKKILKFFY